MAPKVNERVVWHVTPKHFTPNLPPFWSYRPKYAPMAARQLQLRYYIALIMTVLYYTADYIVALSTCLMMLFSPIPVRLIRLIGRQGYRVVGLVGVFLLSVSCLSSSFVNSAHLLLVTFSILFGAGSTCAYMSSSLAITEHFPTEHPHHVKATSTLMLGFPVGSFYTLSYFSRSTKL